MSSDNPIFRSINLQFDADKPEHFAHFYPTSQSTKVIKAVLNGRPTPASIVVAAYGSGKSLAAGVSALFVENATGSSKILSSLASRLGNVDKILVEQVKLRIKNNDQGLALFLEGHHQDISLSLISEAKLRLCSFRKPRMRAEIIEVLEAIWKKAKENNLDHISIVWDEFGRHLELLAESGNAHELAIIQRVAEWTVRKTCPTASLVLLLHQGFSHYAANLSLTARQGWRKIEGRFSTVRYVEDSKEIYELIAFGIAQHRTAKIITANGCFLSQSKTALRLGLFGGFKSADELAKTLRKAYPMNPCALHMLPLLSARLAQNERNIFSFITSADLSRPQSLRDLFIYFSNSMMEDSGIGGVRRRWLEIQSALSKVNTDIEREIISTVAVLGLGVSGERVKVGEKLLKFALSWLPSKTVSCSIESLTKRKLLLHRMHNDDFSIWHGTDVDLRGYLDNERLRIGSSLDIISFLSSEIPAPCLRPVTHNITNSIRRYFIGSYVAADDLLRQQHGHPLLKIAAGQDGRIIYCITENREEIKELESFARENKSLDPSVILVVPRLAVQVSDTILELAALKRLLDHHDLLSADPFVMPEIKQLIDAASAFLMKSVSQFFKLGPQAANWFSNDKNLSVQNNHSLQLELSTLMDRKYRRTPKINNEIIVRHKLSRPMINARKKLILGILERTGEKNLGFDLSNTSSEVFLFRSLISNSGLYLQKGNIGHWSKPSKICDPGLRKVWELIDEFFSRANPNRCSKNPADLFDKIINPPYGWRRGLLPVLFAAGMQAFGRALIIKKEGKYIPDILASEIEEICNEPEKFSVDVIDWNNKKEKYIKNLIYYFGGNNPNSAGDILRILYDSVEEWKSRFSKSVKFEWQTSSEIRNYWQTINSYCDPATLAFSDLPKHAGIKSPTKKTLSLVSNYNRKLLSIPDKRLSDMLTTISKQLAVSQSTPRNILSDAKLWSACFKNGVVSKDSLSSVAYAIVCRAEEATNGRYTEHSFAKALGMIIIGKTPEFWSDQEHKQFAHVLREAVQQVEQAAITSEKLDKNIIPLLKQQLSRMYYKLENTMGPESTRTFMLELAKRCVKHKVDTRD